MVLVCSSTKGMASAAMAVAHSRGLFTLDAPVASYWPEFAQGGKERITVRQLLAHQTGLVALDERITLQGLVDPDSLAPLLAAQRRGDHRAAVTATRPSRWAGTGLPRG